LVAVSGDDLKYARRVTSAADPLVVALVAVLGPTRVLFGPFDKALYAADASAIDPSQPGIVVLPETAREVQQIVELAINYDRPVTPRGSGTGLAGGAVPLNEPIVIVTSKMNRLISVDVAARSAWVEPGMLNLDLSAHVATHGLHYAPDPSSQQTCSIGGNVATNAGGPHCLAQGVTSAHIISLELVLPSGELVTLGDDAGDAGDVAGYDLRGLLVGSEGTMGIVTKVCVRLMANPPQVRTLLADFSTIREACDAVSSIIARGVLPAALEMMDANCIRAVENWAKAGLPLDAGAVLLIELEGVMGAIDDSVVEVTEVCTQGGARGVRIAATPTERALLWKARKSAFGAIATIKPDYYLHDAVVPRTRLTEVMDSICEIADRYELIVLNVFHAGDGNLHPLLVFDRRDPGVIERVHEAGREIVETCIAAGGMLSGEHGIGLEKKEYLPLVFTPPELDHQARIRTMFDPDSRFNPAKVLPSSATCGELRRVPEGAWI
jgi:glycolate oxidase